MKTTTILAFAAACVIRAGLPANAQGTPQIAQALVGMTATNGTAPCVGNGTTGCYGIPNGAVALVPDMLPAPGASTTWYAVFQTAGWSGGLSVTFDLLESGAVVQSATAAGAAAENSTILITVPQTVPSNAYSGAATLSVTTTATPTGGGAAATLRSAVEIEVGASPKHQVVVALAGPSQNSGGLGAPCIGDANSPGNCYLAPPGVAVAWPQNVSAPGDTIWNVVFQVGDWGGLIEDITFTLTEQGTVVMTAAGGALGGEGANALGEAAIVVLPINNGYTGPATFAVTAAAVGRHGNDKTSLKYSAPTVVLAVPAP